MAFTLFVIPTKDHNNHENNNHDNLIYKRRSCSRAKHKGTINECGGAKQWAARGGGGWECEKVNSKNGTIRFDTYEGIEADRQADLHADGVEWGNVTASSQRPAHSLPGDVSERSTALSLAGFTLTTPL